MSSYIQVKTVIMMPLNFISYPNPQINTGAFAKYFILSDPRKKKRKKKSQLQVKS